MLTQQSSNNDRHTCFEMLLFKVDCGLGHGEDQQGGDEGCHQRVHVIPLESGKGDES